MKLLFALIVVTAQLLDYEKGFVFFTTGDGFRVSPAVQITGPSPAPRKYARVTFADDGTVTRMEISDAKLPAQGDISQVQHFAVSLSPAAPNPDLAAPPANNPCFNTRAGQLVPVSFTVRVPATTPLADPVYMTTDQSGWNPLAYRMDRVDPLHYHAVIKLLSGTQLQYLFDRGSLQSVETSENGIERSPRMLCIGAANAEALSPVVYHWADEQQGTNSQQVPQTLPTPFNPAPFPNLPTPHPASR